MEQMLFDPEPSGWAEAMLGAETLVPHGALHELPAGIASSRFLKTFKTESLMSNEHLDEIMHTGSVTMAELMEGADPGECEPLRKGVFGL